MATLKLQQKKSFSEQNMRKIINLIIGLQSSVNEASTQCLRDYIDDGSRTYSKGEICIFDGYIWEALTVTQGAWDSSKWTKIGTDELTELDLDTIKSYLNLSQQDLDNLQNLIDDAQITLTKTHSSSKIYMDIQQCLEDSKTYTLKEISKLSGASYKVVTSTSEMTSESIIYLLASGTTYDMYIVEENGTKTRIGDTTINLDNYFTKSEIEADFLKKDDADSKYATITTVDGKVDKTDIIDNLTSTDTNKPLSANQGKVLKDEVDNKVDKTDITTIIDSSSTDEQLGTALAMFKALDDKNVYHFSSPTEGDANTLVIKGKSAHYQISNAVMSAGTITNLPPNLGVGGLLISHGLATVHQFFLTHNNRVYKRYGYWANSGVDTEPTWVGTWERVITEGDLNRTVNGNGDIRIEIPENADMNDYVTAGFYKILGGSIAKTIANLPIQNACLINVYGNSTSATGWMTQEIIADNAITNNRYIRYKVQNNTDWSPWEKIVTTRVVDVGRTFMPFTPPSNMTVYNTDRPDLFGLYYIVRNGVCYVDVTMAINTVGELNSFVSICSGLPKPAMSYVRNEVNSWNDKTAPTLALAINGDSNELLLSAYNLSSPTLTASNPQTYFGYFKSFSYPVIES